ncbi:hypothetical protein B0H13DRAFT_1892861 [Mycena leptocephala]|nr:hypothetical protein B0H13DRAFT_1892861 [Mycena leptocephala]
MTRDLIQRTLHNGGGGGSWRKGSRQGCEGLLNLCPAKTNAENTLVFGFGLGSKRSFAERDTGYAEVVHPNPEIRARFSAITARFQLESRSRVAVIYSTTPASLITIFWRALDVPDGVHSLNNLAEDGRARCGQIPRLRNGVHLGHAVSVAQPASDPPLRRWLARGNVVGAAAMLPNGAGTRGMGLYGYGECIHAGASSCVRGLAPGTVVSSGCKATSRIQRMRSVEEGWAAAGSAFQRERQLPLFYHPATHSFRQRSEQLEDRER